MKRVIRRTAAVLALAAVFAGPGAVAAPAADPVAYRLKWLFNSSVVGDLYADVHGYFADRGLDVTVKAGGPERDAIKELELGQAQFGVASADQVIRALAKGSPVVVLAQLFQVNPLQWIYRASRPPIEALADLRGMTVGITYGGNDETIMRTLLAKGGLAATDVRLFSVRYDFTPFYRGRVDIWPMYRNSQGIVIAERMTRAGEPVRFFNPADFGVRFVANSVVTSRAMVEDAPAVVARFAAALTTAWQDALDEANTERALATIARFDRDTPPDLMGRQLAVTRELVRPTPDFRVGTFDVEAWRQTERIMLEQGQIEAPVEVVRHLHPLPMGAP